MHVELPAGCHNLASSTFGIFLGLFNLLTIECHKDRWRRQSWHVSSENRNIFVGGLSTTQVWVTDFAGGTRTQYLPNNQLERLPPLHCNSYEALNYILLLPHCAG